MPLRHHPLLPFAAALAGVGFLSLMDAFMKEAALMIGAYTATVLRAFIGAALIAPVWLSRGPAMPSKAVWKLHLTRGVVSAFMALTFFFSLTLLPLAEAIALSFIAPLIALYLASVLLGEVISRAAIGASVLGFAGTLVIVGGRIGQGAFDEGAALGVASLFVSALLYAYNFIIIRRQARVGRHDAQRFADHHDDAEHRQQEHQRRNHHEPAADPEQAAGKASRSPGKHQSGQRKREWGEQAHSLRE